MNALSDATAGRGIGAADLVSTWCPPLGPALA